MKTVQKVALVLTIHALLQLPHRLPQLNQLQLRMVIVFHFNLLNSKYNVSKVNYSSKPKHGTYSLYLFWTQEKCR